MNCAFKTFTGFDKFIKLISVTKSLPVRVHKPRLICLHQKGDVSCWSDLNNL